MSILYTDGNYFKWNSYSYALMWLYTGVMLCMWSWTISLIKKKKTPWEQQSWTCVISKFAVSKQCFMFENVGLCEDWTHYQAASCSYTKIFISCSFDHCRQNVLDQCFSVQGAVSPCYILFTLCQISVRMCCTHVDMDMATLKPQSRSAYQIWIYSVPVNMNHNWIWSFFSFF